MRVKSLKVNVILNFTISLLSVICPLITFPYISRVLGVEQLGKYNFANSVVSYFSLFAGLGIISFAIVEGAKIKEDYERITRFASELFTINIISTLVAQIIIFGFIIAIQPLRKYLWLILLLGIMVWSITISVPWIYTIYEDFLYKAVRSIIIQVTSIILTFVFVRRKEDIYIYALIMVIPGLLSAVFDFFYSRKYCHIGLVRPENWKRYMPSILSLFATSIAVTVYSNTDITMLGFMRSQHEVGIYSVSVKVYNIVKALLLSVNSVIQARVIPILEYESKNVADQYLSKALNALLALGIPCMVGIFFMSDDIILFLSGSDYMAAESSLKILSLSMILAVISTFYSSCILVPKKYEKSVLWYTIIAAVINFIVNMISIPKWGHNAAAMTTMLAEGICLLLQIRKANKEFKYSGYGKNIVAILLGCFWIVVVLVIVNKWKVPFVINIFLKLLLSAVLYFATHIILKNGIVYTIFRSMLSKMKLIFVK